MFTGVNLGWVVEMELTRAKFKIWGQHRISKLNGVNLGRGSTSGLNTFVKALLILLMSSFKAKVSIFGKNSTFTQSNSVGTVLEIC